MDHEHHALMTHSMVVGENSSKEYFKFALIILAITLVSWFLNSRYGSGGWFGYLRLFMGVFFVVFASFKLLGYQMFTLMFAGYDVVAKRFNPYAYIYPFLELGLGILYLADLVPFTRDFATILVMVVGTIGVVQEIKKRTGIHCACLGNVIKLPLSNVSLVEDVGMGLMAVVMLAFR